LLTGLILTLLPAAGLAQTGPYLATVIDPEVKLRPKPSDTLPETATLRQGDTVLVDHEESNGWLAVQRPPGKMYWVSWVRMQQVNFDATRPIPQNVEVTGDAGAALRAGQIGVAQPINIGATEVPKGTILTVIGPKASFDGGSWFPVMPTAGDFRYL